MDDLPELPFERILHYLSLEDRLNLYAVSRSCRQKMSNYKVKTLCYSGRRRDRILGKNRLASGAFARNFIRSARFERFINAFAKTFLSGLKHLRLCDTRFDLRTFMIVEKFQSTLNLLDKLEELDLVRVHFGDPRILRSSCTFKLKLPMLTSIRLESSLKRDRLILDTPRLLNVEIREWNSDWYSVGLRFIHNGSVERLLAYSINGIAVENLKNLKILYFDDYSTIDAKLLFSLEQLKEVHLQSSLHVPKLFEQKRRYGRTDLKIYLHGLLLDGPGDPITSSSDDYLNAEIFAHLVKDPSRLAVEIPFYYALSYEFIELAAPALVIDVVNRFTDLKELYVDRPVQNIQRFLDFLKHFDIVKFEFGGDQPQALFDQLPEHCAAQELIIHSAPQDFEFLSRLKDLIRIEVYCSIDVESIRGILKELRCLAYFRCNFANMVVQFEVGRTKKIKVHTPKVVTIARDANAAVQFLVGHSR